MRKKRLFHLVVSTIIIWIGVSMVGCDSNDASISKVEVFYESDSHREFSLLDQSELNDLARVLSKESEDIKIVENASFVDLKDSKGGYKAITVRYKVGDISTSLIVPLTEVVPEVAGAVDNKDNAVYYVAVPCEMKCIAESCDMCKQEVIERCVSQSCTCVGLSSGCTASIIYPE